MFSQKRKFGNIGEDVAVKKLTELGFVVIDRNYLKKWGEIDIVARGTDRIVRFIEVKTVSREIIQGKNVKVPHETWRPEDNVHPAKLKRMVRAIETWIADNELESEWQIDVITITLDTARKRGVIKYIENII